MLCLFLLLGFVSKLGGAIYTICMRADRCDKSNDISICNLKEFECIQSTRTTQDYIYIYFKKMDSRFKIQESEKIFPGNLESGIWNPRIFRRNLKIMDSRFKSQESERILSGNLES